MFFIKPGQKHEFLPNPDSEFAFLALDEDVFELDSTLYLSELDFFQNDQSIVQIQVESIQSIWFLISQIQDELRLEHDNQTLMLTSAIVMLLLTIQRHFRNNLEKEDKTASMPEIVRAFNRFLQTNDNTLHLVKDYAKHLHVSPNYLNICVKAYTGKSAKFWIEKHIIIKAKRYLKRDDIDIVDIALMCGFKARHTFFEIFKKHTQETPIRYRKKL